MRTYRTAHSAFLANVPLFSHLSADELDSVAELLSEVAYSKGEIVYREAEPAGSFHVILSGEIEIVSGTEERVLNRLGPGDFMGEISLLQGTPRSATARASRAARLLVLDRETFDRHFRGNPKVVEHFARILSQRLASSHRGDRGARRVLTVGVAARPGLRGKTTVGTTLAGFLKDEAQREVLLLRPLSPQRRDTLRAVLPTLAAFSKEPADHIRSQIKLGGSDPSVLSLEVDLAAREEFLAECYGLLLEKLGDTFPYVVFDLPSEPAHLARAAHQVCDSLVEIIVGLPTGGEPGTDSRASARYRVINLANPESVPVPLNNADPYVLAHEPGLEGLDGLAALAHLRAHRDSRTAASLRRLARKIMGRTIGIAVGGGAAFGIAHVGVFEVLEANGIDVDLLAGTSMGSIVATGYAAGMRAAEMRQIARRIGNVPTTLSALDFTLTKPGLLAGNRLIEIFSPLIGDIQRFEDLQLPVRFVATDIQSGERVTMGTGRLDTAFRASCSVPMLWAPVRRDGHVLVDGAIVDPVPAEVVTQMGADICIAVNVVPPLRKGVETVVSRLYRQANRLNPLSYLGNSRDLPNMFDVVMNSIQMLQHELGNFKSISADVRIVPDLSEYTWVEFYRAEEFIDRGVEATERALPDIRRVLAEHQPN